ncbi:glycosyltransferase [Ideonella sp. YS5]|uniref:glycosyltransferase n=1 Tax=Ideonella sp. YS5 TaxID=3453714 RepID=UPI003EEDB9B0
MAHSAGQGAPRRIAVLDGGSFVLPYDEQLVAALARRGAQVSFFGSMTRYNGPCLDEMRRLPGVRVVTAAVSGSVAPRWRGVLAYAGLLWRLWRERRRFDVVNLQFSVLWPLEWPLLYALRDQLVFTVHNAVPHGFTGQRHRPTQRIAELARTLVFASSATQDDFIRRYGAAFAPKSVVLPHGLLPTLPGEGPRPYRPMARPSALVCWGTVKPYKGVEVFEALARSPAVKARGLGLEVIGRWDHVLQPLRRTLEALGVRIDDRYLDATALQQLFSRDVVFVLPHAAATQSGVLYTLLHAGCHFICSDSGDLGDFMRRHGLADLVMKERTPEAVLACLDRLAAEPERFARAFAAAQAACGWDTVLDQGRGAYFG